MSRSLERLLKLARRTGDRLIVHDPAAEDDIVIMSVGQYEGLLDAKEDLEEYMDEFESFRGQIAQKKERRVEESVPEPEEITYEAPVMNTSRVQEPAVMESMPEPLNTPVVQDIPEEASPFPFEEPDEEIEVPVAETQPEPKPEPIVNPEPLYHPIGEQQQRPVGSNWTPAIALLEEKFRVLTKQSGGEGTPSATPVGEPEPRQVPMVPHEEEMDEFEDDDEPIFFEEPV